MRRGFSSGIGWIVLFFGGLVSKGVGLYAQPMPWPPDLTEEAKPAPTVQEKPAEATPAPESPVGKPASGPAGEVGVPSGVRELKPSLYYLKDKQGNLQPTPGFTLEEFRELYELKHLLEQKAQPPSYSFQALDIRGEVRGDHAELAVEVRVALRESPARIPLGLEGMAVRKCEGEGLAGSAKGEYLLHWEEGGEGYVVWIIGATGTFHRVRLEGAIRVQQVGQQRRLRFPCVRSPSAQMTLRIPGEGLKVEAPEPTVVLQVHPASQGATEVKLEGIGGNVELVWRPAGEGPPGPSSVFEVVGETVAHLDRDKITSQANLFIKVLDQPCDEVELRAPAGAKVNPDSMPGGVLTVEKERIKVHFSEKASEHRIRLEWEQAITNRTADNWVELGGLEVVGAVKHRGYIAVWGPGDWDLLWRGSPSVRQTEQLPPSLSGEGLLAGFEYSSQPYSLRARLVSQQVRATVEPEYRLWLSAREAKLEGVLKYTIRGAKVQGFRVEMPGWELEEVGPEEVVAEGVSQQAGGVWEIPLRQPTGGHVELTLTARRAIPPGVKQLSLPLPQGWQVEWPTGGVVSVLPASVAAIPEENVELTPEEKQMTGWVRQLAVNLSGLPKRQQPILAYRAESGTGTFIAGIRVHERQIQVEGAAQVQVEEDGVRVEQKLSYMIAYEALGTLTVRVPPAAAGSAPIQFLVDGQAVSAVPVSSSPKGPEEVGPIPMAIPLSQPRIGPCDLTIRYHVPWEKISPRQSQIRTVPLAFPAEGHWMGWQVGISPAEGLQIKLVEAEHWKKLEKGPESAGKENRLWIGARELVSEIRLGVYRDGAESGRPLLISRAFVQTWWTHSVREDRAVYRVRGEKQFVVQLPEGAVAEEAAVWVNGQPATFQAAPDGRVAVALPGEKAEAVVEIRYHFQQPRPTRGLLKVEFPRPAPDGWIDRFYWLCHFPRDEHILINPSGLAPEYQWKWNGWSWGRVPRWSQMDLETWAGAVPSPMTSGGVNSYLFSSLGKLEPVSLYTAGRSVLVLTASLAALGIGLLVVYSPVFRHPAWIIVVGVGLGALVLVYPEQTVLSLQAALLGVGLAILAGLLRWIILGRQAGAARVPGGFDQESTQHQYLLPAPGSTSSTQVVPTLANSSLSPNVGS